MTVLKSIVVFLALSNVAYFLWAQGIANSEDAPAVAVPRTLRLKSEGPATGLPAPPKSTSADVVELSNGLGGASRTLPEPEPAPGSGQRCVSVGPFHDVAEAAHAASLLRGGGYDPRQRVIDGDVWAGVWVYVPLPTARAAVDQLLSKLKAAGIDDALEMPGPADGSVISLGLFSEQKRARARVTQVQALGLTPAIVDRKRTGNVYWIDVDLKPTDGPLDPADLQGEAGRISRVEVKPCPAVQP